MIGSQPRMWNGPPLGSSICMHWYVVVSSGTGEFGGIFRSNARVSGSDQDLHSAGLLQFSHSGSLASFIPGCPVGAFAAVPPSSKLQSAPHAFPRRACADPEDTRFHAVLGVPGSPSSAPFVFPSPSLSARQRALSHLKPLARKAFPKAFSSLVPPSERTWATPSQIVPGSHGCGTCKPHSTSHSMWRRERGNSVPLCHSVSWLHTEDRPTCSSCTSSPCSFLRSSLF